MTKIKIVFGAIVILLISFLFSSFFAITTLVKLYKNSLKTLDYLTLPSSVLTHFEIDNFINQQIYVALLIFLVSALLLLIIAWRSLPALENWSIKTVGWPLFQVSGAAQLIALVIYIINFTQLLPTTQDIDAKLFDAVVEIITAMVISALLFFELIILLIKLVQNRRSFNYSQSRTIDPGSIRPVIFLFLFGVDLSAAFIPLHMKNLYQPLLGLPRDVVLGLPISSMFLCVSFTIMIAGIWLDRRGWHEPFLLGLALTAIAMLYAWLAPSGIHFIISMGLAGLGYGLALMASQGFVIVHTDERGKARGLAYLFAGIYAGSICGTAAGAMLAEHIGYGPVFLLSAIIIFLTLGYTLLTMRFSITQEMLKIHMPETKRVTAQVTAKHYWNFLRNRYVLGLIFLSSLPSAIAVIGLLNYFGPVYLDRLGVSQSIIGSIMVLYSICMVYLGPPVSKYIDASDNKRLYVFIGCILGGSAFLSFYLFTGLVATVVAILLLGVSSCFVLASQTTYALSLDVTKQLGQGRAIGIFRASSRIGQMLGPIIFGWLMVATEINQGLTYFGIAYLATAVLFLLLTFDRTKYGGKIICEPGSSSN